MNKKSPIIYTYIHEYMFFFKCIFIQCTLRIQKKNPNPRLHSMCIFMFMYQIFKTKLKLLVLCSRRIFVSFIKLTSVGEDGGEGDCGRKEEKEWSDVVYLCSNKYYHLNIFFLEYLQFGKRIYFQIIIVGSFKINVCQV